MGVFLVGFVLPLLLLTAALLNWSLISLVDVVAFLLILFHLPKTGFSGRRRFLILWAITIFSLFVILSQVTFLIVLATLGNKWSISDSWWAELFGLMRIQSWRSPSVIYFLVVQFFIVVVALVSIYGSRFSLVSSRDSCWRNYSTAIEHLGSHLRVVSCLLLPAIQLLVGISHPSWVSLPFFIGSCTGLVEWSLTSNFLGLFSWWRFLRLYAGVNILLLYLYRLPIGLPKIAQYVASIIGLYKISTKSDWLDICYALSLIIFYIMISYVRCDLEDMASLMSMQGSNLTEQLLPSRHSFFIRQSRSGVRHTNVLLRGAIFRTFCINFFTYGFPISLIALSFWSFYFASVCAFGLLVYVGYILFAFPSLFRLHQLNGLLLVFILLWAVSTYIFNLAFAFLSWKLGKDMEIWEMIGLWHYPIPGFFLLAQFGLGALVAVGNLVNNSVFQYLTDEAGQSSIDNCTVEVEDETKILIVATFAWGLRKSSRGIMLALIFLIAMKPGFIHALYIVFFFIYLLSHSISRKVRQSLILLCEIHFAILYILQLSLVSKALEENRSLSLEIFSQLGLIERDCFWELLEIAFLACICAVHNHGFEMLFSFSAIVQHAPSLPVGFSVLKAGLNKSVLLSVYSSRSARNSSERSSHVSERRIASFISAVGQKFLSMYRSCGTYIAYLTVLFAIYLMRPNYISFGYMFLLLVWLIGRQLFEKTKRPLWLPIKGYAIIVFVFIYSLSIFSSFEMWLSKKVDLYDHLGYNPEASLLQNVWETLAVLIVMQLYSYERRQSKYNIFGASDQLESGVLGLIKRFLVWHIQKILFIAVFYVSLSPVSAFGFIYLFALIICSTLPKASRVPSKLFLVYTGLLVAAEYLFQMWGKQAKMFPGQKHSDLSIILGFQVFKSGFWGLEAGLRAKILVISACSLQYNVFYWVEKMETAPSKAKWEEPCPLFVSERDIATNGYVPIEENKPSAEVSTHSSNGESIASNSYPNINSDQAEATHSDSFNFGGSVNTKKYSFGYICGSTKESHKWNKKRVMALKKERFETQITTFKVYMKFWTENMFNLFGLEINMIVLLLISFTLLNAVSVLYIGSLALCVLLRRRIIRKLWPMFVFMNASILVLEYFSIWKNVFPSHINPPSKTVCCHDCWSSSELYFHYCRSCWLGLIVDDSRMLISYYAVFMFSCFKLCADHLSSLSGSSSYHQMMSQRKNAFVWRDLSFETKSMWTFLDYLRLYCYCHLLDLVLALVLITGTLEYDLLHLGYLGFALVFFRMRLEILKKKNKIFKYLRIYNFVVIVLSLAYQSPFVGHFSAAKGKTIDYIYEVIGFHKYDYGFRITSRSALVEIIIFMLVSLQSYMFSSPEFDYVFRYLEAEQIGAIVREQEKKAAWKTAQLKHIRESDEEKRLRNSQVEKIKSEMLNLQTQNIFMNSTANGSITPCSEGLRKRRTSSSIKESRLADVEEAIRSKQEQNFSTDSITPFDLLEASARIDEERPSVVESREHIMDYLPSEISEINEVNVMSELYDSHETEKMKRKAKENALRQLLGDGVYQVQSIGNQAVTNLASLLNVSQEDLDSNEHSSSEDGVYDELESQKKRSMFLDRSSSLQSDNSRNMSNSAGPRLGRIFGHIWSLIQSNNDVMCYCCFVLVFLWSFSLLSMVYLAALFLYALCVNTGPSYTFWVMMLVYTEMNIFIQYVYQILIQHCGWTIESDLLVQWGFPTHNIKPSFVISLLPLFLVYLFTLIQSSITAKDGEFMSSTEYGFHERRSLYQKAVLVSSNFNERVVKLLRSIIDSIHMVMRSLSWYWKSLTQGTESPPYFVQLSLDVHLCPEEAIQPEKIESGINQLLRTVHDEKCNELNPNICPYSSRVHVQSIERSQENPEVALAVLEIVYAASLTRCTSAGWYKSLTPAGDVAQEILIARNSGFVEDLGFSYPILSVIGGGKREVDLYAYIFGADLSVFFLVAIFYQSVIKNNSEFLELEDQFPKEFVFVLMIIFFLIVLDRIIYLWSFAVGKVFFYLFNLILFTYSVTEYAWNMEASHRHAGGLALRAIYLMKAVSLALQAVQIRYGVPHQSTLYRQYLTSNVSRINHLGYRLYRALPFLYELRCVLDWSCTTTSLTMYDWLKLEDIYSSLFLVKCDAVLNRANHKVGEKQSKMTKFCSGICLFFILICVIWAPMLMYSSGNPTNTVNPIKDVTAQLDIKTVAGRLTLYQSTLCERIPYYNLDPDVNFDPQGFLSTYDKYDIQLICCEADASIMWLVPSVVQEKFIQSLSFDLDIMDITFSWVLNRDRPKGKEVVKYERSVGYLDLPEQSDVQHVLNGTTDRFRISNVYPKYFRVTGSGDIRPFEQEVSSVSADIILNRGNTEWWSFHVIQAINSSDTSGILGDTLSKFSIWGLYITFVLAVGRFIRLQCSDLRMRIPYENLPSCDRLIDICEDLYAARAEGELGVEEVLYWTIVNIYRSPHMLLEYTKPD